MEYKICENCGAKLHVRTLKCPICNVLLTDASKIINDDIQNTTPQENNTTNNIENNIKENIDIKITDTPNTTVQSDNQANVKDYVYKAEVHHSLEYTNPLSNTLKVFISALSTFPLIGQFLGTFLGIFFATYDDNDRKSFGKALILLSVIMFMLYSYSLMISSELLTSGEFSNYLNNFVK